MAATKGGQMAARMRHQVKKMPCVSWDRQPKWRSAADLDLRCLTMPGKVRYSPDVASRRMRETKGHLVDVRDTADHAAIERMLRRIANEIVEDNHGAEGLALVGIRTGGLHLAERLAPLIEGIEGTRPPVGAVDITLYRDDVFHGLPRPEVGPTELPFRLAGVNIVLIDDVLFTGRTVRAALDAMMDYGRPRKVQLAVLVDRGLRELPIAADYVGLTMETTANDSVRVFLRESGSDRDRVVLRTRVEDDSE